MKVSVIIPAHNIEKYIHRCIGSIINQTLLEIEIIVVDDGSTDNTLNKINSIAKKDKRIKVLTQEKKGSIEARKLGFSIATGTYILFVDGDDYLEENALEKLYNTALIDNVDIVLYDAFCAYDHKKIYLNTFEKTSNIIKDPIKNLLLGKIMPGMVFKLIKKSYIEVNKIEFPKDISFAEDLATSISWFIYKPRISILEEPLYNYYQRENSVVRTIDNKILDVDKAISFIKEELINNDIYCKYQLEFEYMVYQHLFIYRIILSNKLEELHKKVYIQYKNRKININKNKYIKLENHNFPISYRIRINCYDKNYYIGKSYDYIRYIIKQIYK